MGDNISKKLTEKEKAQITRWFKEGKQISFSRAAVRHLKKEGLISEPQTRRLTQKEKDEITRLFKEDKQISFRQIALKIGRGENTIYRHLRKEGLIPASKPKGLSKQEKAETIRLFKEGKKNSVSQIALKIGKSHSTVARYLREKGLIEAEKSTTLTKKEKSKIIRLFKEDKKKSYREIALEVGKSHGTITYHLREEGLIPPPKNRLVKKEQRDKVAKLYKKLKSTRKVANIIGCSKTTIREILKEKGIQAKDSRVLSNDQFLTRARAKYGERFDYSRTNYTNIKNEITIGCPIHGFVDIVAERHLDNLDGCPLCNPLILKETYKYRNQHLKITYQQFIDVCNKKYDSKYIYNENDWHGMDELFEYTCPKHGKVKQNPRTHYNLNGEGCNACSIEERSRKRSTDFSEFLKRANEVHNFAYTYSKDSYINLSSSITIKCKNTEHEPFTLNVQKHIQGKQGCYECKGFRLYENEKIIKEANKIHNHFYSYEKTDVVDSLTPIIITCPIHGDFPQLISNHLKGQGCIECGYLKGGSDGLHRFSKDLERADSLCELYLVDVLGFLKIGMAINVYLRDKLFGEVYYNRAAKRACVWCVEQKLLIESQYAQVQNLPEELINWNGYQELREPHYFEVESLCNYMDQELDKCLKIGWKAYAKKHFILESAY